MRWTAVLVLMACLAFKAQAEVAGADTAEFRAAVADWLDDRDAEAVPRLSDMAASGNTAAQILLALIDTTPVLHGDWLVDLPRADRVSLLRKPGGLSGQSWMTVAAETDDVAKAWLTLWRGDAPISVMSDFARLKEDRAARVAARWLSLRLARGFGGLADDPGYPPSARAFAIREWQATDPARAANETAALHPGDPQRGVLGLPAADNVDLLDRMAEAPEALVVRQACSSLCATEPEDICRPAAHRAAGGYWGADVLGTPSEALINAETFATSLKAQSAFVASLPDIGKGDVRPTEVSMTSGSACVDNLILARSIREWDRRSNRD